MRFAAIVLLLAALLIGGYVWYGAQQAEEITVNDGTDQPPSEIDVPTAEGVGTLPDEQEEEGAGPAETGDGGAPAVTGDEDAADAGDGQAADAGGEQAAEAGDGQAADAGEEQAAETGDDQATEAGAGQAAEADASEAEGVALPTEELDRLLTVEGFDFDRIMQVLERADLPEPVKMATRSGLESARDQPELLQTVLNDLRERLGLRPVTGD